MGSLLFLITLEALLTCFSQLFCVKYGKNEKNVRKDYFRDISICLPLRFKGLLTYLTGSCQVGMWFGQTTCPFFIFIDNGWRYQC